MATDASDTFRRLYGHDPAGTWAAPGRVNLIGEHTDYNDGFVLPLALARRCVVTAAPAQEGGLSRVASTVDLDDVVEFDARTVGPGDLDGWAAYAAGMAWSLREAGHDLGQVDLLLDSDVPLGAGLSSSAALECATGIALTDLFDVSIERTDLALLAQRCENDFVGAATGTMDQLASMHGSPGHLVFIDTRTNDVELVPFDLDAADLALLVIDTRAPHALVDGQYAARRRSCEAAADTLGVEALRDVHADELDEVLPRLDEETARRVRHVVTEDARVLDVVAHLRGGGDPRRIGEAMTASHASLRDDFEVTVPHLDIAVDAALAAGAHGARMTGGGFGGSVIALVEAPEVDEVTAAIERAYDEQGFGPPVAFVVTPEAGASRLT